MNTDKKIKSNETAKKFFGTTPPLNSSGTTVTVGGTVSPPSGSIQVNQPIPCC